jgi:hypothetical protein
MLIFWFTAIAIVATLFARLLFLPLDGIAALHVPVWLLGLGLILLLTFCMGEP